MKTFKKLTAVFLLLFTATAMVSCDDDDDNVIVNNETAYDFLVDNDNYSSLKAAVDAAGLRTTLEGSGTFTIFAPDNDAFEDFLDDNDFQTLADVPTDVLVKTLLYHVLGTEVRSNQLTNGYVKTSATNSTDNNLDLYIDADELQVNDVDIDASNVDIEVDNGVIHAIEGVLSVPTVVTLAVANPDFSSLTTALTQEDLVDAVSASGPFTVFAPSNAAFQNLIDADENDDIASIEDVLALENLDQILLFHVASGAVRAEDIEDDADVTTLSTGNTFSIDLDTNSPTIVIDSEVAANIIATDVTANNGVIHVIDGVLIPGEGEED